MMRIDRRATLAMMVVALAACKGEQKVTGSTPSGQILPGSASDAMLPLDTVRSQPPLAPRTEAAGRPGKDKPANKPAASDAPVPAPPSGAATEMPVAPTPVE